MAEPQTYKKSEISNTNDFIIGSKIRFGEHAFDYSDAVFAAWDKKITLKCAAPSCSRFGKSFEFLVSNHLGNKNLTVSGQPRGGCLSCGKTVKYTFDVFSQKGVAKFNSKYRYLEDSYSNFKEPTRVYCTAVYDGTNIEHGDFEVMPEVHLRGRGACPQCTPGKIPAKVFKVRFAAVHNGDFDYSLTDDDLLVGTKCRMRMRHIACDQEINPIIGDHLRGGKCNKCRPTRASDTETFGQKGAAVHNGFYTYDNVNYVNNSTKVWITCPDHGDFEQIPKNHLQGHGCGRCA